jgi:hypothetical protein
MLGILKSVMMQSHDPSPPLSINSAADVNPRASYPSERSNPTSAIRNDSSSSMTEIMWSLDMHHPLPGLNPLATGRLVKPITPVLA